MSAVNGTAPAPLVPDGIWAPVDDRGCICEARSVRRLIRVLYPYRDGAQFRCYCGRRWLFVAVDLSDRT